ncbi:lipopolysaccharide transport periplasmic protein LptA [Thermodesulfobacteriota bacterium]
MSMYVKNLLLFTAAFVFCFLVPEVVFSADAQPESDEPIHIEADRMESSQEREAVVFSGNVEAKQGDFVIHAQTMTVFYITENEKEKEPGLGLRKIRKFIAVGNVKMSKEGWLATGDAVEYFGQERKVVLTGSATLLQDNNLVTGDEVILYLEEGKSIVKRDEQSGNRVKAYFYPDSGKKTTDVNQPGQ